MIEFYTKFMRVQRVAIEVYMNFIPRLVAYDRILHDFYASSASCDGILHEFH